MPNINSLVLCIAAPNLVLMLPPSALQTLGFLFSSPSVPHLQGSQLLHHAHQQVNGLFRAIHRVWLVVVVQH